MAWCTVWGVMTAPWSGRVLRLTTLILTGREGVVALSCRWLTVAILCRWSPVAEMNYCRRNAGVISHSGVIYVIGGDDGTSNLASVEMYNPKTDSWSVLAPNMTIGRSYTGVCVIDKPSFL